MQEEWDGFHELLALRERHIRQREDQEQAERRQIQELLPLPRRAVPLPWEDLASVITRTPQVMGYPQPDWILHPQKERNHVPSQDLPSLFSHLSYTLPPPLL